MIARISRTPQYIILFVSATCWMRCRHCWFNEEWKAKRLTSNSLTFDEYERLADSINRIAFLGLTGGEAFQRDDIVELGTMFRQKTKLGRYQIPTSGYRTDKIVDASKRLLEANPKTPFRVDVSLDGVGVVHNHIRSTQDAYERACETIVELNALKRHYDHFDLGVITTISSTNQHNLDELAAVIERIHASGEWMINVTRGLTRDPEAGNVQIETYLRAHQIIQQRIESGTYQGHCGHLAAKWLTAKNAVRRRVIAEILAGNREGGRCAAGSLGGVVYSDGSVNACEMLDTPLGNLRDFDFDFARLWSSEAAVRVRRSIQLLRCQCTQECFLSVSMLEQPDVWAAIARERIKLGK